MCSQVPFSGLPPCVPSLQSSPEDLWETLLELPSWAPCSTDCTLYSVRLENGTILRRYQLSQLIAKMMFITYMIVIYGSNEKQQRRHWQWDLLGVGLWLLMFCFSFFLFFFHLFLFWLIPHWQTCIQGGMEEGLCFDALRMKHAMDYPRVPTPALPWPQSPPTEEMAQTQKASLSKRSDDAWQPK